MDRLNTLLTLVALDRLPRSGWVQAGVAWPESIAGHVLGTAQVACLLAPEVQPGLDMGRLLTLIVVHDAPEALTGDLPRPASELLPSGAKRSMEEGAARRLFESCSPTSLEAWREYAGQESREARFARGCDRLQLGLRLLAYRRAGQRGLDDFEDSLATLDTAEFPVVEELRQELMAQLQTMRKS